MKTTFDITAIAMLVWIGIGKILIPLFVPPVLLQPTNEVMRVSADASTEVENLRSVVGDLKNSLSDCATASSVNSECTKLADAQSKLQASQDATASKLQASQDALAKKFDDLKKYVDLLPKSCPPPKIPKELTDKLQTLEHRIEVLEPLDRTRIPTPARRIPQNKVQSAIEDARASGKSVLFYYTQDDCPFCPQFERGVWETAYVRNSLREDVLFYTINKDHLQPGENFSVPSSVPAVQLLHVFSDGVKNSTISTEFSDRTPERFVALVRAELERKMR